MTRQSLRQSPIEAPEGAYRYHLVRAAIERFRCGPFELDPPRLAEAESQARRTLDLESLVLASCEALNTIVPEQRLEDAVAELRGRYPDATAFAQELARNGLDEAGMRRALHRELTFDAVMLRVGACAEPVTEIDERLFYELHRERFESPERRAARHILVTINEDYPENRRAAARARIERIASELRGHVERFDDLARRHSECPTAMQGGSIGQVSPRQLFPALDRCLFALDEGAISGILESDVGFHLLLCERIEPARVIGFEEARPKIRTTLTERRRRDAQREWIRSLQDPDSGSSVRRPTAGEVRR